MGMDTRWCKAPVEWDDIHNKFVKTGSYINGPAMAVPAGLTLLLILGVKESSRFNCVMVSIKLLIVFLFVVVSE